MQLWGQEGLYVDLLWKIIIGITWITNSSNSVNVKLLKFFNNVCVAYFVAKTS